jgi:hypothetical protein
MYGQGTSGSGGNFSNQGQGGSGGLPTTLASGSTAGGLYGGGGGGTDASFAGSGSKGAVRIIWGAGRAFPSTNTSVGFSTAGETTI